MPMYSFKCGHCDNEYDVVCSIAERDDKEIVHCTECGSSDVHRVPTCGAFVIDGKMAMSHPNSPDGVQRTKETKRKHWKKGKKHFQEWVGENKARAERDKKWSYSE